ncbi:hypothetical protein V8G54_035460 [Vigna mungo]|uniref:Uncharacterized protein n=1 Tax=Vigna mungo TaxID=3915 RepID=A0AAQ3MFG4_VIGMU
MKPANGFSCVEAKLSLLACLPFLTSSQDSPSTRQHLQNLNFVRHVNVLRQPSVNFQTLTKTEPFNFLNYVTLMSNDCRAMAGYAFMVASNALQSHCQQVSPYHTHKAYWKPPRLRPPATPHDMVQSSLLENERQLEFQDSPQN